MKQFSTRTTGKWILVGEHSVLRGVPALVFPLETAELRFGFQPEGGSSDIRLQLEGPFGTELDLLFWGVVEKACSLTNIRRSQLQGLVRIDNHIPVGAGLGASAAFCVAIARWFASQGAIAPERIEAFACELENLFHGESSGLDIAVVQRGRPLKFRRGEDPQDLVVAWRPNLYLTYSGHRGVTRECVHRVKELLRERPEEARGWDEQMRDAVDSAEHALRSAEDLSYDLLCKSFRLASSSFRSWGLFDRECEQKEENLLSRGADIVKPTGSGGGGYLLSLWPRQAPDASDLLPCFSRSE